MEEMDFFNLVAPGANPREGAKLPAKTSKKLAAGEGILNEQNCPFSRSIRVVSTDRKAQKSKARKKA